MKFLSWLKAKWLAVWAFIVKVIQEVAAPITDYADHLDGYKIGGFIFFGIAGFITWQIVGMASRIVDAVVIGKPIDAGIITVLLALPALAVFIGNIGKEMFSHARNLDTALLINKPITTVTVSQTGGQTVQGQ